jgi:hypothetical protein
MKAMNPIKGIISVAANYGIGKTTFALECGYHPKDIIFINDDVKETGLEKDFKKYVDLVAVSKKMKMLELHSYGLDLILNLPKTKVIIWDTWTQFASTFPVYVKAHMNEFRNSNEWSAMGKIKSGEVYQEAYRYEGAVLSELKSKCDLLILTFHLKQHYENNVAIPNKMKPGHDKSINKYADLRLWLTHNPGGQVPAGLVLKNISKRSITKQGIKTEQVLPLRLEQCNWKNILAYWNSPIADREPVEGERPDSFELSLIEGTLTPEDKRLYEASLSLVEKQAEQENAESLLVKQEQAAAIKKYATEHLNGLPSPIQINKIKEQIEVGNLAYDGEITTAILR